MVISREGANHPQFTQEKNMFVTSDSAEVANVPAWIEGERCWHWMRLALQIPTFLIHLEIKQEDGSNLRTILTSSPIDIQQLQNSGDESIQLRCVDIIMPGYLSESGVFQLHRLKQVWSNPSGCLLRFVMVDGKVLYDDPLNPDYETIQWQLMLEC
jgi:hypothetical protein